MTAKWNRKKYSLEVFCLHHSSKYSQLVEVAQHAQLKLPNNHTCVGYLLDTMGNQDADLRATITHIRKNTQAAHDSFEN